MEWKFGYRNPAAQGHGSFSSSSWDSFTSASTKFSDGTAKPTAHVFTSRGLHEDLDPSKIVLRESCDSVDNPESTPIMINFDVTGSMGGIPDNFVRHGMKTLFEEIYARKPVAGPQIAIGAIGDVKYDRFPYQISQFESDIRVAEHLTKIFLEGGGCGNSFESYNIPWAFAAQKTKIDSFLKRQKRGYLFTLGDEEPPNGLSVAEQEKVFGKGQYTDLTNEQLLEMAERHWHVFHIIVEEGHHCRGHGADYVHGKWKDVLGQRVLRLSDHTKLAEVIVAAIQQTEGLDTDTIVKSWSGDTSLVVSRAIGGLTKRDASKSSSSSDVMGFLKFLGEQKILFSVRQFLLDCFNSTFYFILSAGLKQN